jgi:hypothetical protein
VVAMMSRVGVTDRSSECRESEVLLACSSVKERALEGERANSRLFRYRIRR